MLYLLLSLLLLALLIVDCRVHLELNIPQFFQIGIDRFQLSGFSGVLLHEHFQFRLPLLRGQLFARKSGIVQLALYRIKLPDLAVMFGFVLFLFLSEAAFAGIASIMGFKRA